MRFLRAFSFRITVLYIFFQALVSSAYSQGFVTTSGTDLMLNGKKFYLSGGCSYAMTQSIEKADAELDAARKLHLNSIRIWGFDDGNEDGFQPLARVYN